MINNADRIKRAIDYVKDHPGEKVTIAVLAEVACMSQSHFSRQFRLATGDTPMDYVTKRRIEYAKIALVDKSISKVAFECGFANQSHMTRAFSRATGMTPAQYRNVKIRSPIST
jgi:AraC family transcriptional regulator